jgi:hypothetical protein
VSTVLALVLGAFFAKNICEEKSLKGKIKKGVLGYWINISSSRVVHSLSLLIGLNSSPLCFQWGVCVLGVSVGVSRWSWNFFI